MGSDKHYPEERPVHRVTVDGFWMDRYPVTNARFAGSSRPPATRTFAEIPPESRRLSRRAAGDAVRRLAGVREADRPGRSPRHQELVALGARAPTGATRTARQLDRRAGAAPGRARRLLGCAKPSRSGRARRFPPKPNGSSPPAAGSTAPLRVGRRIPAGRPPHGQHLARRVSLAEPGEGRLRVHLAGRACSRRTATACYDMIGNVWEWTTDWYQPKHPADAPRPAASR